ncbi:hypothetical protein PBI_ASERPROCKY_32 [Gordonia phage ASerpRocky]|uniref:Uncharacterized protein n=1 Tax=Gordonia phage ASerpRocky TaxID=2599841 RepID=A0A5J6TFK6_9CAUD|nr:hypothetical protein PBI_ASERPROCKY_32 [Gordonia phage ASerpRocky]
MAIRYYRNCYKPDSYPETEEHVRSHIASIASPTDDPTEFHDEVQIEVSPNEDGSVRIFGVLDREPACDYSLPDDYEPPSESEYQQGFGVREMTPAQLHEHLMQKEVFE